MIDDAILLGSCLQFCRLASVINLDSILIPEFLYRYLGALPTFVIFPLFGRNRSGASADLHYSIIMVFSIIHIVALNAKFCVQYKINTNN